MRRSDTSRRSGTASQRHRTRFPCQIGIGRSSAIDSPNIEGIRVPDVRGERCATTCFKSSPVASARRADGHGGIVHPAAEADVREAAFWYEATREGLGAEFTLELDVLYDRIAQHPSSRLAGDTQPLAQRPPRCVRAVPEEGDELGKEPDCAAAT